MYWEIRKVDSNVRQHPNHNFVTVQTNIINHAVCWYIQSRRRLSPRISETRIKLFAASPSVMHNASPSFLPAECGFLRSDAAGELVDRRQESYSCTVHDIAPEYIVQM